MSKRIPPLDLNWLVLESHDTPMHVAGLLTFALPEAAPDDYMQRLARRLREARPRMKVLYMSGYAADSIVHRGVLEEGAAFLPKPMKADMVRRKVREVLDAPAERRASV